MCFENDSLINLDRLIYLHMSNDMSRESELVHFITHFSLCYVFLSMFVKRAPSNLLDTIVRHLWEMHMDPRLRDAN